MRKVRPSDTNGGLFVDEARGGCVSSVRVVLKYSHNKVDGLPRSSNHRDGGLLGTALPPMDKHPQPLRL